jgi:two-component sensor histidine kinase
LLKKVFEEAIPVTYSAAEVGAMNSSARLPEGPMALLPLRKDRKFWGVLAIGGGERTAFTADEMEWLRLIAEQIGMSLQAAGFFTNQEGSSQKRDEEFSQLEYMSEASRQMAACLDFSALMKIATRALAVALHCPIVGIAIRGDNGHFILANQGYIGIDESLARSFHLLPMRGSLVESVFSSRAALALCGDASDSSDPLAKLLGTTSIACAPLLEAEGSLGIIFAAHPAPHRFEQAELAILSTYASQAALVMSNLMLRDDLTKHLDRLSTFSEFTRTLASSLELNQTLKSVLAQTSAVLETEAACILLKEGKHGCLKMCESHGVNRKAASWAAKEDLNKAGSLAALCLEQDKILISKDLARDGRYKHRHLAREEGPDSCMVSPLKAKNKPLGALCVCSGTLREFTEYDKRLLALLADEAGIAIENARLYEQEKERVNLFSSLIQEANHRIRNSLQTIAGLLEMELTEQGRSSEEALRKSIERIECVGAVHGLLSRENPEQVDMKESSRRIGEIARRYAGRSAEEITLHISGARVMLSSAKAASLSMAIIELLDNALHHGLRAPARGRVMVSLSQSDREVMVTVSDDGAGLPADFDLSRQARLGLRIVTGVVTQDLGGEFQLDSKCIGTTAQIRFPR